MKKIISLEEARDEKSVGGKAASLAAVSGVSKVPQGFVIKNEAFREFLRNNEISDKILSILARTRIDDRNELKEASRNIMDLFRNTRISDELRNEIEEAYKNFVISSEAKKAGRKAMELIKAGREKPPVVVRSSPQRDGGISSGIYKSTLNIKGDDKLIGEVKEAWKSFYTPEAIYYREKQGYAHDAPFGVIVQKMVNPDKTLAYIERDPCDPDLSIIEGVHGMGSIMFEGEVKPDFYFFSSDGTLRKKEVNKKDWIQSRNPSTGEIEKRPISSSKKRRPLLDREEVNELYSRVSRISSRLGGPVVVEFCTRNGDIHVLDIVPLENYSGRRDYDDEGEVLFDGLGFSPGKTRGEISRSGRKSNGKVLMKNVPSTEDILLEKPKAVLTRSGGYSSNYAKLARELEIPCIMVEDSDRASPRTDEEVLVDAHLGKVFSYVASGSQSDGYMEISHDEKNESIGMDFSPDVSSVTATEIMLHMDPRDFNPDRFGDVEGFVVEIDGSGRTMGGGFGIKREDSFVDKLKSYMGDGEMWLKPEGSNRSLERLSNIINGLESSSRGPVKIILPASGYDEVGSLASSLGVSEDSRKGIIVDTPELLLSSDEASGSDIDIFLLDFERLSQLFFGHDNRGKILSSKSFWNSVEDFCKACKKAGSVVSVSDVLDKRYLKKLIERGVDSLIVHPENFSRANSTVARVEKKLLLERMR